MPVETVYYTKADRFRGSALLCQAAETGTVLVEVHEKVLKKMCSTATPQGVAGVVRRLKGIRLDEVWLGFEAEAEAGPWEDTAIFLILDRIQDPGNLGGILRVALATDVRGILLMRGCADPYGSKALRGSMGSLFGLKMLTEVDVAECRDLCSRMGGQGHIAALTTDLGNVQCSAYNVQFLERVPESEQDQETPVDGFMEGRGERVIPDPLVLILGNEGQGIAPELLELAGERWSLPMCHGVESLNVAVTAGIVLYGVRCGKNWPLTI